MHLDMPFKEAFSRKFSRVLVKIELKVVSRTTAKNVFSPRKLIRAPVKIELEPQTFLKASDFFCADNP